MISIILWLLSITGFWLLCIVTARHRKLFHLKPLSQRAERIYKTAGFILLGLALAGTSLMPNPVDGILVWFGILTFASLLISALLAVQQQRKREHKVFKR